MSEERLFAIVHGTERRYITFAREYDFKADRVTLDELNYIAGLPYLPSNGGKWNTEMTNTDLDSDRLIVYWRDSLVGFPVVDWTIEKGFKSSIYRNKPFVYVDALPRYTWNPDKKHLEKIRE